MPPATYLTFIHAKGQLWLNYHLVVGRLICLSLIVKSTLTGAVGAKTKWSVRGRFCTSRHGFAINFFLCYSIYVDEHITNTP
jgi:hypothetical protein